MLLTPTQEHQEHHMQQVHHHRKQRGSICGWHRLRGTPTHLEKLVETAQNNFIYDLWARLGRSLIFVPTFVAENEKVQCMRSMQKKRWMIQWGMWQGHLGRLPAALCFLLQHYRLILPRKHRNCTVQGTDGHNVRCTSSCMPFNVQAESLWHRLHAPATGCSHSVLND